MGRAFGTLRNDCERDRLVMMRRVTEDHAAKLRSELGPSSWPFILG
jgi:hypothetical protein